MAESQQGRGLDAGGGNGFLSEESLCQGRLPRSPAACRALGTELPPSSLEKAASPRSACCQAWAVDKLRLSCCPGASLLAQRQDTGSSRTNPCPSGRAQSAELEQTLLPWFPLGSERCCQLRWGFPCSAQPDISRPPVSPPPVCLPGSPSSGGSSPASATEARTCWAATSWPGATSRRPASSWWT